VSFANHHRGAVGIGTFLLLLALACSRSRPEPIRLAPGDHDLVLQHQGRERGYLVHVPPQARDALALPVVLNFHGGGSNAAAQRDYSLMDRTADQEGFLAVYPDGSGPRSSRILTWNAGRCCGYAMEQDIDDVGFVLALLDDLARRTPVDRSRIYATGLSNGAMMAYRLAVDAAEHVAAIAPVAGAMGVEGGTPARAIPVLHIHSVDDPRALYEGGEGPPFPWTNRTVVHKAVEEAIREWVEFNGCPTQPTIETTIVAEEGRPDAGHTATGHRYAPCEGGADVVFWQLTGAGHVWPGGRQDHLKQILGPSTQVIDANEVIWSFFSKHALEAGSPTTP